jgi:YHS domain-containing protein
MHKHAALLATWALLISGAPALAQLPADAVILDKLKISEKQKSVDLCPVYLEASDPKFPEWEYQGVKYRGSKADAKEKFLKEPDKYVKAAEKQRFVNNFKLAMSTVWCPVTDEVTPGGLTKWTKLGLTWESCCAFCDETVSDDDFPAALKKLEQRALETYKLIGAKYTEGAKSPVEGAIKQEEPVE